MSEIPSADYNTEFKPGSVKAAIATTGAKERSYLMVPIDDIVIPEGFNVRAPTPDYQAHIEFLADSVSEHGFYPWEPLKGYAAKEGDKTVIYCVGGTSRLLGARLARKKGAMIEALPVAFTPNGTSMIDLQVGLVTENTGKHLTAYEKSISAKRLIQAGLTVVEIAQKWGVTRQSVDNALYLQTLPQPILTMVAEGQVAARVAIDTAREIGASETVKLFTEQLKNDELLTGDPDQQDEAVERSARAGRIRPRATGVVSKRVCLAAIDYAIALPGDGIEFLVRWRKNEADAMAEVAATLTKPKAITPPKAAGKRRRRTKAQIAADDAAAALIGAEADRQEHDGL